MANWLRVKENTEKKQVIMPSGRYLECDTEEDTHGVWCTIQAYGIETAFGGAFWGSVLTLGGLWIYNHLKKHKEKKQEEESEEQEDDAE